MAIRQRRSHIIMGLDIHGWIEITYVSENEAQDDTMWMGVTRLAPLVDVPGKVLGLRLLQSRQTGS